MPLSGIKINYGIFVVCLSAVIWNGSSGQAHAWFSEGPSQVYSPYQMFNYYQERYAYPYVLSEPIDVLPPGFITIIVGGVTYYYCSGVFYQKDAREGKYLVVPPPIGAVVYTIPRGYQMMVVDRMVLYVYDGVYYRRTLEGYQVVGPPV